MAAGSSKCGQGSLLEEVLLGPQLLHSAGTAGVRTCGLCADSSSENSVEPLSPDEAELLVVKLASETAGSAPAIPGLFPIRRRGG